MGHIVASHITWCGRVGVRLLTDAGKWAIRRPRWFGWGGKVTEVIACGAGRGGCACSEVLNGSVQYSRAHNL